VADIAVVALVASRGGVEAVSRVLSGLPEAFGAAVIVLIHQDPAHASELAAILDRRCALAVAPAEEGRPLQAGHVIVAPPGRHVLITHESVVMLVASGAAPPSRPSADLLLTTLALAVGPRTIAVVLSGGGHDGATGATVVHQLGGTVVATDEATSTAFAMPSATIERAGAIDRVVGLERVAPLLVELVSARR
jgi:two-component system, chemotaxis family, protein-glutamate methylesterase/glutaminase